MALVYKVTSPTGKVYVGFTSQPFAQRKYQHIKSAEYGRAHAISAAIRKYGDALTWEIVADALSDKDALAMERSLIAELDTRAPKGYNIREGGEGGGKAHPDTCATLAQRARERLATPQGRQALDSLIAAGKTPEARAKMADTLRARAATPEGRAALEATQRKAHTHEVARKTSNTIRSMSPAQVVNIRIMLLLGARGMDLAEWFGSSAPAISRIRNGRLLAYKLTHSEAEAMAEANDWKCSVAGCSSARPHQARGLCSYHYMKAWRKDPA